MLQASTKTAIVCKVNAVKSKDARMSLFGVFDVCIWRWGVMNLREVWEYSDGKCSRRGGPGAIAAEDAIGWLVQRQFPNTRQQRVGAWDRAATTAPTCESVGMNLIDGSKGGNTCSNQQGMGLVRMRERREEDEEDARMKQKSQGTRLEA